jgi:hypothetical protein
MENLQEKVKVEQQRETNKRITVSDTFKEMIGQRT